MILEFKVFKIYARQLRRQEGQEESKGNSIGFCFHRERDVKSVLRLVLQNFLSRLALQAVQTMSESMRDGERSGKHTHIHTHFNESKRHNAISVRDPRGTCVYRGPRCALAGSLG